MIAAILLLGLSEVGPSPAAQAWPAHILVAAGAAATMFLFQLATKDGARPDGLIQKLNPSRPQVLLCSSLALLGVGQLLAPGLFFLPANFLMETICLLITLLLAGAPPRVAGGRAAASLALILSNAGRETAVWLEGQLTATSLQPLIVAPATRLSGLITLLTALIIRTPAARAGLCPSEAADVFESSLAAPDPHRAGAVGEGRPEGDWTVAPSTGGGDSGSAGPIAETADLVFTSREEDIMGLRQPPYCRPAEHPGGHCALPFT